MSKRPDWADEPSTHAEQHPGDAALAAELAKLRQAMQPKPVTFGWSVMTGEKK